MALCQEKVREGKHVSGITGLRVVYIVEVRQERESKDGQLKLKSARSCLMWKAHEIVPGQMWYQIIFNM